MVCRSAGTHDHEMILRHGGQPIIVVVIIEQSVTSDRLDEVLHKFIVYVVI